MLARYKLTVPRSHSFQRWNIKQILIIARLMVLKCLFGQFAHLSLLLITMISGVIPTQCRLQTELFAPKSAACLIYKHVLLLLFIFDRRFRLKPGWDVAIGVLVLWLLSPLLMVGVLVWHLGYEKWCLRAWIACCRRLTLGFYVWLSWDEQAWGVSAYYLRHLL